MKRIKTKYRGVYYTMGQSLMGEPERVYYIRYRRDGREFEEKVGRQFQDAMTPSKAAMIRAECIEGKRLPRKETRSREKKAQKKSKRQELNGVADSIVKHKRSQETFWDSKQNARSPLNTTADAAAADEHMNRDERNDNGERSEHDQLATRLKASEEKFWTIFENANDLFMYLNSDGYIVNVNNKLEERYGYRRENVIGKHYLESGFHVFSKEVMEGVSAVYQQAAASGQAKVTMELEAMCRNGTKAFVEASSIIIKEEGKVTGLLVIIKDISERKKSEFRLKAAYNEMENKVMERTANLEEMNTALKVLLEKRDEDRFELEKKVLFNVEKLIMPSLEKLKKSNLAGMQKTFVDIIENNLNDIVSPFFQGMHSWNLTLTPTEIQVANFIKQQKTTKEIAELLNMSISAVVFHRHNIRKKLGLVKKKINLKSYLQSTT